MSGRGLPNPALVEALSVAIASAWQMVEVLETGQSFMDQQRRRRFSRTVAKAAQRALDGEGTLEARAAARLLDDDVFVAFAADPDDPARRRALSSHIKVADSFKALLGSGVDESSTLSILAQAWVGAVVAGATPIERLIAAKQDVTNDTLLHIIDLGLDAHVKLDASVRRLEAIDALVQRGRTELIDLLAHDPIAAEDADLTEFRMSSDLTDGAVPPYVPRDVDDRLDARLKAAIVGNAQPFVTVVGATKSGKSRCLFEALRRVAPEHVVLVVRHDRRRDTIYDLVRVLEDQPPDTPWVVFVDDLYEHLRTGTNLSPAVRRAASIEPRGSIVATCAPQALVNDKSQRIIDGLNDDDLSFIARNHELLPLVATDSEQRRAEELLGPAFAEDSGLTEDLGRFPELLAAIPELIARADRVWYELPASSHHAALLLAATQLALAQGHRRLDRRLLRERAACIHRLLDTHQRGSTVLLEKMVDDAESWAGTRVGAAYGLLTPIQGADDTVEVLDALLDHLGQDAIGQRFAPCCSADLAEAQGIASAAYGRFHDLQASIHWTRKIIDSGDAVLVPEAWHSLGHLLRERGENVEAESAFRTAIATGEPDTVSWAKVGLGNLLESTGRVEAAVDAFRDVIATGANDPAQHAAVRLGLRFAEQGKADAAEGLYQEAIASGPEYVANWATIKLGELFVDQGRTEDGEAAFRSVITGGHRHWANKAKLAMGEMYSKHERAADAEAVYLDVIESRYKHVSSDLDP